MTAGKRKPITVVQQLAVHTHDRWMCQLCHRPTIFPLALKLLAERTLDVVPKVTLAYWNPQWRRDLAPLLDELAACVDHRTALSNGGAHEPANFQTLCARCNQRKSSKDGDAFLADLKPWRVNGKYGDPKHWDGLSSAYVAFARQPGRTLTSTERAWLTALEEGIAAQAAR